MAKPRTLGRMLSLRETAESLGISEQTLYGWRHKGWGPRGYRLGAGGVRYREFDILEWLEAQADVPREAV